MAHIQARYGCPVCEGVEMSKVRPSGSRKLLLDYCGRCGGMWFDQGEVELLGKSKARSLNTTVVLREQA